MSPNLYQKASQTYQRKNDESLTPLQIVVELYKGMIRNTKISKQAWQEGHLDVMSNHISKTFDIIEALQSNLDMENGGEDSVFLNRFYTVIFSALSQASSKPDPVVYFDEIIAYMQQVHDRWYALAYGAKPSDSSED
jgi:flagellar biosynthetic protein FliS